MKSVHTTQQWLECCKCCIIFINQIKGTSIIKIQRRKSLPFFRKQSICYSQLQLTILHASGYILSVTTPWLWVTWSTISFSAALFTSFHLRSDSGSTIKSKRVQHCWSFWINKLSFSFGATSRKKRIWGHSQNDTKLTMTEKLHQEFRDMVVMTMTYDCHLNVLTIWGHDKSIFCEAWTSEQGYVRQELLCSCVVN